MCVNHNLMSLNVLRYLGETNWVIEINFERFSFGLWINFGKDGLVDMIVSEIMWVQIFGFN